MTPRPLPSKRRAPRTLQDARSQFLETSTWLAVSADAYATEKFFAAMPAELEESAAIETVLLMQSLGRRSAAAVRAAGEADA